MGSGRQGYRVGEVSALTGVKAGTIRFYEKCGFLETVERLPNQYRLYNAHHIYQVQICRLVFGGFVNKRLRKNSMGILWAAKSWDLEAYREATEGYRKSVEEEIDGTKKAIGIVMEYMGRDIPAAEGKQRKTDASGMEVRVEELAAPETKSKQDETGRPTIGLEQEPTERSGQGLEKEESKVPAAEADEEKMYSKKEAARILGVTPEAIRNWERNGLLPQAKAYQKRYYGQYALNRMYVIRLLLDTGYSIMVIRRFLNECETGYTQEAEKLLFSPKDDDNLQYMADRYLEALLQLREKADKLCGFRKEMEKI